MRNNIDSQKPVVNIMAFIIIYDNVAAQPKNLKKTPRINEACVRDNRLQEET